MKDLQNLIDLAKQVAKPAYIAVWILGSLLFVSVCGNVYQATRTTEVDFIVDDTLNVESNISQSNR